MIYTTEGVHPRERLTYWREVATRGYVEHDFTPDDAQAFNGSVQIATLPGIDIAAFKADAGCVTRPERYAARANSGDLLLTFQLSGKIAFVQDGRETVFEGRGLVLTDSVRAFDIKILARTNNIVVRIPRDMFEARIGNTADLTARSISSGVGIANLTMGFLELLPDQAETLDNVSGLKVVEHLLDLASLSLTSGLDDRAVALSSPRVVALTRLKATVEHLMIEPGLKPDQIAAKAGISVRYANDLLAQEGTSLERYLNERRLERCRSALESAAQSHRSVGEIAFNWGFSDLSHFGRRFKARYGHTPTDYRRNASMRATVSAEKLAVAPNRFGQIL